MPDPLRLSGVTKRYGAVTALEAVDLTIRPGECHCLVGPNGSGKTTLLDLLLGLTRPTNGTVSVPDGTLVGAGFQTPTLYPGLTVRENLDVFARLSGCPDAAWRAKVVETLGLEQVRTQVAGTLSGGWQKKLDLALALLKRPPYVLLDEPCADLDDVSRRRFLDFLDEYCTADRTVLIVTHDLTAFGSLVDRLTVVDRGRIRHDGPPEPSRSPHEQYLAHLETG